MNKVKSILSWVKVGVLVTVAMAMVYIWVSGQVVVAHTQGTSMLPTLHSGEMAVLWKQDSYERGDIVAYVPDPKETSAPLVMHRIVAVDTQKDIYYLKGDNNYGPDTSTPQDSDVTGRVLFVMAPWVAYVIVMLCGGFTLYAFVKWWRERSVPATVAV